MISFNVNEFYSVNKIRIPFQVCGAKSICFDLLLKSLSIANYKPILIMLLTVFRCEITTCNNCFGCVNSKHPGRINSM